MIDVDNMKAWSLTSGYAGAGLGAAAAVPKTTQDSASNPVPFQQELVAALRDGLGKLNSSGDPVQIRVEEFGGQTIGGVTGNRQYLITLSSIPAVSGGARARAAALSTPTADVQGNSDRLPPIGSDTSNRKYTDFENPIPRVVEQLQELGIDSSNFKFELRDDEIANLGGHYTNHLIHTTFPNGRTEDFSIEWTLRNPKITAVEIARLMKLGDRLVQADA